MHCNFDKNDPIFLSQTFHWALMEELGLFIEQRVMVDLSLEKLLVKTNSRLSSLHGCFKTPASGNLVRACQIDIFQFETAENLRLTAQQERAH